MGRKNKSSKNQPPTGCMAFFVSLGRTISQRAAVARNALRRKFRRNNPDVRPLEPDELENETGTPDLVFKLKPVGPIKAERLRAASLPEEESTAPVTEESTESQITTDEFSDKTFHENVRAFVDGIIKGALIEVKNEYADREQSESLTSTIVSEIADLAVNESLSKIAAINNEPGTISDAYIRDTVGKSPASMDSSEISQIAEIAVTESLSKIAAINNETGTISDTCIWDTTDKSPASMDSSEISQIAEIAVTESLSKIAAINNEPGTISDSCVRDTADKSPASMDSSEISQIADLAVSDSLSKLAASENVNTSARRRPRSVNEMLEYFGIPTDKRDDGMPPVDI